MNSDLYKINYYFEEGGRLWNGDPERVTSREFYELWENIQRPLPFLLPENSFELFGIKFELPKSEHDRIGYFCWDNDEMCPALRVETLEWEKKFLLIFNDGEPQVYENDAIQLEQDELSVGEKLEIVYDVIGYCREHFPDKDIFELTKKEFVEILDLVSAKNSPKSISAMKRISAAFMKLLLKKATADMATDEISSQLSLPLDGNYSAVDGLTAEEESGEWKSKLTIPARTPWQIAADMEFIETACRFAAENEKDFVLTFADAEIIGTPGDKDVPVKLHADPEMPLTQGDILSVFCRGEKNIFGTFKVDIFDGDVIFGRLRCDDSRQIEKYLDQLFATLQRSPRSYLAESVAELLRRLDDIRAGREDGGALPFVLGFKPLDFSGGTFSSAPEAMDLSQKKGWAAAVNAENPVVLIQGPPGTGKTYVMEQVVRELCRQGLRILITAPSNTAVDNICRRIADLPALRFGKNINSIAPDVAESCWIGEDANVSRFVRKREELKSGGIYAGTHVGLLRDDIVTDDMRHNGKYDVIIFDEAGMASLEDFLLCSMLGKRTVLFGDHQQLPPFPLPEKVLRQLKDQYGVISKRFSALVSGSALEWLAEERLLPVVMLQRSYRCQNPRLLRFSSMLFYDAGVRAARTAEYYRLSYHERKQKYPPSTLRFYSTSLLPPVKRKEYLFFEGQKPGLANPVEAYLCCYAFYQAIKTYPLEEISIIAPYRKQVAVIRENLSLEHANSLVAEEISPERWERFLFSRIATVDSFQGGESDIVIICYVRSNKDEGIGFIDNPNRINVAHTRCRREIVITGDLEGLKRQAKNQIFERMERAFRRDGELIEVTEPMLAEVASEIAASLEHSS